MMTITGANWRGRPAIDGLARRAYPHKPISVPGWVGPVGENAGTDEPDRVRAQEGLLC